jgi:hypothetical protein
LPPTRYEVREKRPFHLALALLPRSLSRCFLSSLPMPWVCNECRGRGRMRKPATREKQKLGVSEPKVEKEKKSRISLIRELRKEKFMKRSFSLTRSDSLFCNNALDLCSSRRDGRVFGAKPMELKNSSLCCFQFLFSLQVYIKNLVFDRKNVFILCIDLWFVDFSFYFLKAIIKCRFSNILCLKIVFFFFSSFLWGWPLGWQFTIIIQYVILTHLNVSKPLLFILRRNLAHPCFMSALPS